MKKITNKFIFTFMILNLYAVFAEAGNLDVKNTVSTAVTNDKKVEQMIKVEVQKQVKDQIQDIKDRLVENTNIKTEEELQEEKIFNNVKFAHSDVERVKVYYSLTDEESEKINNIIKKQKTEKIFNQFDFIINKLDSIKNNINNNLLFLDGKVKLEISDSSLLELETNIDESKERRARAWIKMQKINFEKDERENILAELKNVKLDLVASKIAIKKAYIDSKKMISVIREALVKLK